MYKLPLSDGKVQPKACISITVFVERKMTFPETDTEVLIRNFFQRQNKLWC